MGQPRNVARGSASAASTASQRVFNCVVDENALLAAGRQSIKDGLRKWVSTGAIRLFVPLHTLDRLHGLKKANKSLKADALDVIEWLDNETSNPGSMVTIQGVDEAYETWSEVEKLFLPATLLSTSIDEFDLDDADEHDVSPSEGRRSPEKESPVARPVLPDAEPKTPTSPCSVDSMASPGILNSSPLKPLDGLQVPSANTSPSHSRNSSTFSAINFDGDTVPLSLRSLFSHVLWLVNRKEEMTFELDSILLLTNDLVKKSIAQRFGVRVKSTDQLRTAIKREAADQRNRLAFQRMENSPAPSHNGRQHARGKSNEDNAAVLKSLSQVNINENNKASKVFDPNAFGRGRSSDSPRRSGRGGQATRRAGVGRGIAGQGSPRSSPPRKDQDANPIDPNSYARPPPANRNIRGGRGRLWEPN